MQMKKNLFIFIALGFGLLIAMGILILLRQSSIFDKVIQLADNGSSRCDDQVMINSIAICTISQIPGFVLLENQSNISNLFFKENEPLSWLAGDVFFPSLNSQPDDKVKLDKLIIILKTGSIDPAKVYFPISYDSNSVPAYGMLVDYNDKGTFEIIVDENTFSNLEETQQLEILSSFSNYYMLLLSDALQDGWHSPVTDKEYRTLIEQKKLPLSIGLL